METRSEVTIQDLKRDLDNLRSDLKNILTGSRHASRDRLADAKSRLWDTAHNLETKTEEQFRDAYNVIRDRGAHALEIGREQVEKRPMASLLWSFGLGMVLGRLLLRR